MVEVTSRGRVSRSELDVATDFSGGEAQFPSVLELSLVTRRYLGRDGLISLGPAL